MPVLMIALIALLLFGLVGVLLIVAVSMEHSRLVPAAKGNALTTGATVPYSDLR